MTESEVSEVVNACPNARFHLSIRGYMSVLPSIRILKHQLESVFIFRGMAFGSLDDSDQFDDDKNAWDACVNLSQLWLLRNVTSKF